MKWRSRRQGTSWEEECLECRNEQLGLWGHLADYAEWHAHPSCRGCWEWAGTSQRQRLFDGLVGAVANTECASSYESDFSTRIRTRLSTPSHSSDRAVFVPPFLRSMRASQVQKPGLWSSWTNVRWFCRHPSMKTWRTDPGGCRISMIPQQVPWVVFSKHCCSWPHS